MDRDYKHFGRCAECGRRKHREELRETVDREERRLVLLCRACCLRIFDANDRAAYAALHRRDA